eukprot:77095-Amphidinium_carterae.1
MIKSPKSQRQQAPLARWYVSVHTAPPQHAAQNEPPSLVTNWEKRKTRREGHCERKITRRPAIDNSAAPPSLLQPAVHDIYVCPSQVGACQGL